MTTRPKLRVILVDDEPPAREQLLSLLATETDIEVVGEAGGGSTAIRLIRELKPDLVFLDVQMPGCDGFEVLRTAAADVPSVIFVTAYDEHAIRAFEVAAVDYLLKPVVESRFRLAVRRAIERSRDVEAEALTAQLSSLLDRLPAPTVDQVPFWCEGKVVFVRTHDIDWVDAADDHVRVHVGKTIYTTRETMTGMEARLPSGFVRVHRSSIVNINRIREVQTWLKGDYVVILQDGTQVVSGRTYRDRVRALLPP